MSNCLNVMLLFIGSAGWAGTLYRGSHLNSSAWQVQLFVSTRLFGESVEMFSIRVLDFLVRRIFLGLHHETGIASIPSLHSHRSQRCVVFPSHLF